VHYQCAACINTWLDELGSLPRNEFYAELSRRMDRELHRNYRLYPCNYIAYDMLSIENSELRIQNYDYQASAPGSEGCGGEDTAYRSNHNSQFSIPNSQFGMYYTLEDKQRFEKYLAGQLAKITIPNKDEAFLRERMLTMYANPVRNKLKSYE
jgi:hypothetical protein